MKEIKAIDSWEQLTVAQFEELCRLQEEHPTDCAKYIIEYLYDVADAEQLPIIEYSVYMAGLQKFIGEPVLKAKLTPSATYTIHGRIYRVDITPADFSVAQYTDLTNYLKSGKASLIDLLAVVVIPDGHLYQDGYDMRQVRSDVGDLPLTAGFAVVGFFGRWSKSYMDTFLRSLTKYLMKGKTGKMHPELVKKLAAEVEAFSRLMASRLS